MLLRNFIFFFLIFLIGCGKEDNIHHYKDYIFGTIVDIKIHGETKKKSTQISNLIFDDFQRLHGYLHPWEESLISQMNHSLSQKEKFIVDDNEIIRIIQENKELAKKSNGYFNPAIGKLIAMWGFHDEIATQSIPTSYQLESFMENIPVMENIIISDNEITSKNINFQLDLGGYAKGYALDRAKKILENNGISNALINIGGNIIAIGKRGEKNWVIGIQHPRKPTAIATIDLLPGWSIGTSGDYQRYFVVSGKRYSHLIDPTTGYPATNSQSSTIMIPPSYKSGVLSDVYSKPLFIAPKDKKINIAQKLLIDFYMVILNDGQIMISDEMNKSINWVESQDEEAVTIY